MDFRRCYRIFFFAQAPLKLRARASNLLTISLSCLGAGLLCLGQSAKAQAPLEDIEQISRAAAQFLAEQYSGTNTEKVEIKLGNLDQRLRLNHCGQDLAFALKDAANNGGNINVQVSCSGPSSWTILVPAQARVYRKVAVAGRNLKAGDAITAADLTQETKDVGDYRFGFVLSAEDIVGKELKYPLNKGEVFRNSALAAPLLIKRGDSVSIESAAGDIRVRTLGTAASDGRLGQQIRIKNNQSARIVNARVTGAGTVQSLP
jgi:flagella basal body P-ring formation protein FlgA